MAQYRILLVWMHFIYNWIIVVGLYQLLLSISACVNNSVKLEWASECVNDWVNWWVGGWMCEIGIEWMRYVFPCEPVIVFILKQIQQYIHANHTRTKTRNYMTFKWYSYTVYPMKYAHGFCFAVLCCGYTLTDFPISIRLTSLALWQSNDYPSASKATLMNMDKYFMWIHYERLHNHNKAKHNKTVCIFLGIYCICVCIHTGSGHHRQGCSHPAS